MIQKKIHSKNGLEEFKRNLPEENYSVFKLGSAKLETNGNNLPALKVDNENYHFTVQSFNQLMSIAFLSRSIRKVDKVIDEGTTVVYNAVAEVFNSVESGNNVGFKYDENKNVLGFWDGKKSATSVKDLLDMANPLTEITEDVRFHISDASCRMSFIVKDTEFGVQTGIPDDNFKLGIAIDSSSINMFSPSAYPFLERLVCTNGAVVRERLTKGHTYVSAFDAAINLAGNPQSLVDIARSRIWESIKKHSTNNAAYADLEALYYSIRSSDKNAAEEYFAEYELADKLATKGEVFPCKRSKIWKSTFNSGINSYKFLNYMTEKATHSEQLSEESKIRLQSYAGMYLMTTPLLADVCM